MATYNEIVASIVQRVEGAKVPDYSVWRIGITQDIQDRYKFWRKPEHWMSWEADSLGVAQDVESYFINEMGMQGGTGGDLKSSATTYVYIF